ncbi:MAG: AAA family ATPase [Methylococcaceae bacterium]|nr:AAA family ATPase [Methylococcaceae bacterium]
MLKDSVSIQIIGSDITALDHQSSIISSLVDNEVSVRLIDENSSAITLSQANSPDILIFLLESANVPTLDYLSSLPKSIRPALLVITSINDPKLMRLAMQAGARDFFVEPVDDSELQRALVKLVSDCQYIGDGTPGILTTVINAKGGSGGSVIACNLAHVAAVTSDANVLLIDMDLQFGTQSLLLDLRPAHTIVEALDDVNQLDFAAIDGYMSKHISELRLLSMLDEHIVLPGEISVESLNKLLMLTLNNYDRVFIDLPRLIDPVSASILDKSEQILIIVQQNLANMRDAKRLIKILKAEFNVNEQDILVVVNRYNENSGLDLKNIESTLEISNVTAIPNDYERVAAATNLGKPLFEYARHAEITHSLIELAMRLGVNVSDDFKKRGFFKSLFGSRNSK